MLIVMLRVSIEVYEKSYYNEIEGNGLMECTLLANILSRRDRGIRLYC
jgi:hypothetical protein